MTQPLQAATSLSIYDERLSVTLGFITLVFVLAFFTTCRSFTSLLARLGFKDSLKVGWYQTFYKYHAYYWPVFWVTFVLHVTTALMHTDLPQLGDPDAAQHLYILASGLISFVALVTLGFSCRIFASLFHLFTGKSLTEGRVNSAFYKYHPIYWLVLLVSIAVLFIFR